MFGDLWWAAWGKRMWEGRPQNCALDSRMERAELSLCLWTTLIWAPRDSHIVTSASSHLPPPNLSLWVPQCPGNLLLLSKTFFFLLGRTSRWNPHFTRTMPAHCLQAEATSQTLSLNSTNISHSIGFCIQFLASTPVHTLAQVPHQESYHLQKEILQAQGLPQWFRDEDSTYQSRRQGVWSVVQEDPTCYRATKPVHHNYWVCALEPMVPNKKSHHNEKPMHCYEE